MGYEDDEDKTSIKGRFEASKGELWVDMNQNLAHCGVEIHESYRKMMGFVEKEQYFLVKWFMPTLAEISKRENYKKAWTEHLSHFGRLLDLLKIDTYFFEILTKKLEDSGFLDFLKGPYAEEIERNKPIVANNIFVFIKENNFSKAFYWADYGKRHDYLTEREFYFLRDVVTAVQEKNAAKLESLLSDNMISIFSQDQINFLKGILTRLKAGIFATSLRKISAQQNLKNKTQIKKEIIEALKAGNFRRIAGLIDDRVTQFLFGDAQLSFLIELVN